MPALTPSDETSFAVLMVTPPNLDSSPESKMEEEGSLDKEDDFVTVAHPIALPGLQHYETLGMTSISSMSQHEYEQNLMSIG